MKNLTEEEVRALLAEMLEARSRRRRALTVLAVGVLLGVASSVLAGVPRLVAELVARAGQPGPTEVVPRQIAYSGTLELNNAPVTTPTTMQVNLLGADGGSIYQQTFSNVPLDSKGRFRLELGDTATLDSSIFAGNFVEAELTVAGQRLSRQRLLSVPYAMHSGDVITRPMTLTVGASGNFARLEDALIWTRTKVIRAPLTLRLQDGDHQIPVGLDLSHPDGRNLRIIGNTANPSLVRLTMGSLVLSQGALAQLDGIRLVGPGGTNGLVGINVYYGGVLIFGPNAQVDGFAYPIQVEGHSMAFLQGGPNAAVDGGVVIACSNNGGAGVSSSAGSQVQADFTTVTNCASGFSAQLSSGVQCSSCSISNSTTGWLAQNGSAAVVHGGTTSSVPTTFYTSNESTVTSATPFPSAVCDPPRLTVGNYNSIIYTP